jgi:hypothetical protein
MLGTETPAEADRNAVDRSVKRVRARYQAPDDAG